MTRIVFSDGSKQMAHNLDDQYERWQMRREELAAEQVIVSPEAAIDVFVPDLPEFASGAESKAYRAVLVEKQAYLQTRLSELNLKRKTSHFPDRDFFGQRAPLALAVSRVNLQMHQLMALGAVEQPVARIAQLKAKEKDASITVVEQIEIAALRALESDAALRGNLRKAERSTDEGRLAVMENVIVEQRKWLNAVQAKLIAAYERIIELEARP